MRVLALDGSQLSATGNIFGPPTGSATLHFESVASATLTGNHILSGGGWSVVATTGSGRPRKADPFDPIVYDLSGNYWGTADGEQIRAWVYDIPDHPYQPRIVQFEPFLTSAVATERRGLSQLKALFGGGDD